MMAPGPDGGCSTAVCPKRSQGSLYREPRCCRGAQSCDAAQPGRIHPVAGCGRSACARQDREAARGAGGSSEQRRTLLSSPWAYFNYRTNRARFVPTSLCQASRLCEWLVRKMSENLHMQTGTWLTSRELTEAAGPWDTRLISDDDGEYYCRVLLASEGTVSCRSRKCSIESRIRAGGVSSALRTERRCVTAFDEVACAVLPITRGKRTGPKACLHYMQNWFPISIPGPAGHCCRLQSTGCTTWRPPRSASLALEICLDGADFWVERCENAQMALPQTEGFGYQVLGQGDVPIGKSQEQRAGCDECGERRRRELVQESTNVASSSQQTARIKATLIDSFFA